jgi:5-methyltetrahydropteroyltriglutamate--homocysteine methyltransferase
LIQNSSKQEEGNLLIRSCDVGSLPPIVDSKKFVEGANRFNLNSTDESTIFFEKKVLKTLVDKIKVGIDVPNFPQLRDMNEMFLSMMDGVERIRGGFLITKHPSLKIEKSAIPEIIVIEKHSKRIQENKGAPFKIRICVTGPYTLSSSFPYKGEDIFIKLGKVISKIVENSIFNNKHGGVSLVSLDEPVFGLQDDALIDFGSEGRENLQKSWESIFNKVKSKKAQSLLHLHSTVNELFWDIESLQIIESHVDDPLLKLKTTKEKLESTDKFLKGSIAVSEFNSLIKHRILSNPHEKFSEASVNEKIAKAWTNINHGKTNPEIFLEDEDRIQGRLTKIVDRFGIDRIPYAGPECGLKGFPTYKSALENLRRISYVIKSFRKL